MSEMVLRYLYEFFFYNLRMLPILTNINNIFKLVILVLVMRSLTDYVYFVGIVS